MTQTTAFGEDLVAQLNPKAGWVARYTPNTRLYTTTGTSGGSVTVDDNRFKLATTNTAGRTAVFSTRRNLLYLPGMGGLLRFTLTVDDAAPVGAYQTILIGNGADGFGFGKSPDGPFGTLRRRGGSDFWTAEAAWNGRNLDFNKNFFNIFQVRYQWLGAGHVRFYVLDPDWSAPEYYAQLTTLAWPNTSQLVHIKDPTLPVRFEVGNGSNAYNVVAYSASAMAFLEGNDGEFFNPLEMFTPLDASGSFNNTSNNHALTVRNKALYTIATGPVVTQENRTAVDVVSIVATRGTAGATRSALRMYRNGTVNNPPAALSYSDYDQLNSAVDFSTTTTTVASTNAERTWYLNDSGAPLNLNFRPGEIFVPPGEWLLFGWENNQVTATEWALTITLRER